MQNLTRVATFSLESGSLEITDSFLIFVDREGNDEGVETAAYFTENIVTKGTVVLKENTIFIGDQLFTDVWGAKKLGIQTWLVKPIHPKEEIQIVLKRKLEWIVLYFYHKKK